MTTSLGSNASHPPPPSPSHPSLSLDLMTLMAAYQNGTLTPLTLVDEIYGRIASTEHAGVFIFQVPYLQARSAAQALMDRKQAGEPLALYGIPFAVKDNIDVAELETTAACPAFTHRATQSAGVVARLLAHGALLIGKTNLDQFATGLVGVRSPYGIPTNPFDANYITGGSSSGSAVAVSRGFCSFALGTDTAGSGRVPAAFNNIVGLKPTRGMLTTCGVVPACRSLDCVSIFALTVADATEIAHKVGGFDAGDPHSRKAANGWDPRPSAAPPRFRFATPNAAQLQIDQEDDRAIFRQVIKTAAALGGNPCEQDMTPFDATAALLYAGPYVAQRLEAAGDLLAREPDAVLPVIRQVLASAPKFSALDAYLSQYQLERLRTQVDALWNELDFLLVPSAPDIYRIEDVIADPITLNSRLGTYTNFVNLLDLCALAIPAGFRRDGLPFGVTLIARAGREALLASIGARLHAELVSTLGATRRPHPAPSEPRVRAAERAALAVVGAHLSGEPLNHQLTNLGGRLLQATRTASSYKLFALPTTPPKPGLVRVGKGESGAAIELEVWELSNAALGEFMRGVGAPLCIGTVELADGSSVLGFLVEGAAVVGQPDITKHGGWRAYRRSLVS